MEISKVKLDDLLNEISNTRLSLLGDWHGDNRGVNNEKQIIKHLPKDTITIALEYPKKELKSSPLYKSTKCFDTSSLITTFDQSWDDSEQEIYEAISSYLLSSKKVLLAVLGHYHLDKQKRTEVPKIVIQQSFNGNNFIQLKSGIYILNKEQATKNFLIKDQITD